MQRTIFMLILLLPVVLFSQIQWQNNGVPVRTAENIRWNEASVTLTDGSVVVAWQDTRDQSLQNYAQRFDSSGNKLWAENGINISNTSHNISRPIVSADSDGNVFAAWYFCTGYYEDYFFTVQKISASGELLWTSTGSIFTVYSFLVIPSLTPDDNGGVYCCWEDNSDHRAKLLLSDGSLAPGWDEAGTILVPSNYYYRTSSFIQIDGELIFTYSHSLNYTTDIYIQKYSADGQAQWGTNGYLVSTDVGSNSNLTTIKSTDGFWVGWKSSGNENHIIIYRFFADGSLYWTTPLQINTLSDHAFDLVFVDDAEDNLYVGWNAWLDDEIHIAKIDNDQNLLWGDQGIIAQSFTSNYNIHEFRILPTSSGNLNYICGLWEDDSIITFNQFDSSGNSTLIQPLMIDQFDEQINSLTLNLLNNDSYFIGWNYFGSGFDEIKYQIIDNNNQPVLSSGGEVCFSGHSGEIFHMTFDKMDDLSAITWQNSYGGIYMELLDNNGTTSFENGIEIKDLKFSYSDSHETFYDDVNDILIIGWQEEVGEIDKVFLQAIDSNGNILWDPSGIRLSLSDCEQYSLKLSCLNGYTYVAWTESDGDFLNLTIDVFANKIDVDGNRLWGNNGIQISNHDHDDVVKCIYGRCIVWQNEQWQFNIIYATLLDGNGNTAPGWNEYGNVICDEEVSNRKPAITSVPGGYIIAWIEHYDDVYEIYGQFISEEGQIQWEENGILLASLDDGYSSELQLIYDDALYLGWDDMINYIDYVCVQKFDLAGNALWPDNGINVPSSSDLSFVNINDHILIVSDYKNGEENYDIAAALFDSNGEQVWQIDLCDLSHSQREPIVIRQDENNLVVTWKDNRAGNYGLYYGEALYTGIYAQNVYIEPTYTPDEILAAITGKLSNYPNPFNPSTTISFELTAKDAKDAKIEIYNLKGQKVKILPISPSPSHTVSVIWDGTDDNNQPVSSGVYFYKLKMGKLEETRKMLLLK